MRRLFSIILYDCNRKFQVQIKTSANIILAKCGKSCGIEKQEKYSANAFQFHFFS